MPYVKVLGAVLESVLAFSQCMLITQTKGNLCRMQHGGKSQWPTVTAVEIFSWVTSDLLNSSAPFSAFPTFPDST